MDLTVLSKLYDHADDVEAETITEVALKADLLWQCRCGIYNDNDSVTCLDCGADRDRDG